MKHTFVHFEIPADDAERAKAFYEGLFGWSIRGSDMFDGWYSVMTSDDEADLQGGLSKDDSPDRVIVSYVQVESIDDTLAKATALGGSVVAPKMEIPTMGWMAHLRDTEGNVVGVFEALPGV
jgi:predicted enzyme related to lactoylglutathione lyase